MIQEISPHCFNNQYLQNRKIEDDNYVLHYNGNTLLLITDGDDFDLPRKKDFSDFPEKPDSIFLFTLDDVPCYLVPAKLETNDSRMTFQDIWFFRKTRKREIAWTGMAGFQLFTWYSRNRFCGFCGAETRRKAEERAIQCPNCKTAVYPNVPPAIIVAITCGDKILLARGVGFSGTWYSLIAGYADIGETLEQTVLREVKEEVGLKVRNIRYYTSQPWPLSGSMMIGFTAQADDSQQLIIEENEISEAGWFQRGNLPEYPSNKSIAGTMIERFERGEL